MHPRAIPPVLGKAAQVAGGGAPLFSSAPLLLSGGVILPAVVRPGLDNPMMGGYIENRTGNRPCGRG